MSISVHLWLIFKKPAIAQILLQHLFCAKNKIGAGLKITPLKKIPASRNVL